MAYYKDIMENGMTIRACPMEETHSITLILRFTGGAAWEPKGQKGITHLVEHLCFRRCANLPQEEFYYKIERTGGSLRGITYRDRVLFEITVSPAHFYEAADMLRILFEKNGWTHEDIRREKKVLCRQIEDGGDYCLETMFSDYFSHSEVGETIAGTKKKIERLTRPQIESQKAELFSSENCEIILTGAIALEHIEHIRTMFSEIKTSAASAHSDITPKYFLNRTDRLDAIFTDQTDCIKVGMTFDIDLSKVASIEAQMLQETLCNGLLTPLTMRLREELGLLHEIQSGTEFYYFGGLLYLIFNVDKADALLLLNELIKILKQQKERIDRKAFDCVRAAYTDGAVSIFDDPKGFAYELAFDDSITTPQSYIERNAEISYERIRAAAKEILQSKNLIVSLNDIPPDDDLRLALIQKKEQLRKALIG